MPTPTEITITTLRAFAGLQALVGNGDSPETFRIYNIEMEQDTAYPAISIHKVAQTRENTMADSGGSGVENARVRISVYDEDLSDCEAVQEQVRLALKNAESSTFAAVQIFNIDQFNVDSKLYQVIVDYSIWYRH